MVTGNPISGLRRRRYTPEGIPNSQSLEVLHGCRIEPGMAGAAPGTRVQFERLGYFCVDPDTTPARPVFNRTVSLRDTWARIAGRQGA